MAFSEVEFIAIGLLLKLKNEQANIDIPFSDLVSSLIIKLTSCTGDKSLTQHEKTINNYEDTELSSELSNTIDNKMEEELSSEANEPLLEKLMDETTVVDVEIKQVEPTIAPENPDVTLVASQEEKEDKGNREITESTVVKLEQVTTPSTVARGRKRLGNFKRTNEFYKIQKYFNTYGLDPKGEPIESINNYGISVFTISKISELLQVFNLLCKCDNNYKYIKSMKHLYKLVKKSKTIIWDNDNGTFSTMAYAKLHIFGKIRNCYLNVIQITSNCNSLSHDEIFDKFQIIITLQQFLLRSFVKNLIEDKQLVYYEIKSYLRIVQTLLLLATERKRKQSLQKSRSLFVNINTKPHYLEIVESLSISQTDRNKMSFVLENNTNELHVNFLIHYLLSSIKLSVDLLNELNNDERNNNKLLLKNLEDERRKLQACLIFYGDEELMLLFQQIRFKV